MGEAQASGPKGRRATVLKELDLKLRRAGRRLQHRGCCCGAAGGCNVFQELAVKDFGLFGAICGYKLGKSDLSAFDWLTSVCVCARRHGCVFQMRSEGVREQLGKRGHC